VCAEQHFLEDYPTSTHLASHDVCKICVNRYLWVKIMNEGVINVGCPIDGCVAILGYDEVKEHGGEAFQKLSRVY